SFHLKSETPDGKHCPETVTRCYEISDHCGNKKSCLQTITINDNIPPTVSCPGTKTIEGCDTSAITGLPYSGTTATINLAQFQAEGGNASDNCGIASITYQDSKAGTCPIVVTRTFTVK